MASYHRVLQVLGRSVDQKSVECDHDIHPWDILINNERWEGKVRLIGFVDVFIVICYTGESRFEKGVLIYKDDDAIRTIMKSKAVEEAKITPESIGLKLLNPEEPEPADETKRKEPKRYFLFDEDKGGLDYKITSLGHPIGLKTEYPLKSLAKYDIKIRKGRDGAMRKRILRGVKQHDLFDLMHDAIRAGIITHAQLIGTIIGKTVGGSALEDVTGKYVSAFVGVKGSNNLSLSGERV
ncbi:hypothetical protein QBC38DRAFT_487197 [Podospora fimiseda]|uniref:Uncharacterized protein n=1 Tax=Podospora fimiseda TaxID=252190 RepID=A0AAN7BHN6_9PEZI|nr:hypothetical protein QBC38DRAFT_487197 [Podospora fimiseda]